MKDKKREGSGFHTLNDLSFDIIDGKRRKRKKGLFLKNMVSEPHPHVDMSYS